MRPVCFDADVFPRFVQAVDENEVTVGGERVPISRRRKKELLEAVNRFFKNGGVQ